MFFSLKGTQGDKNKKKKMERGRRKQDKDF